MIPRSATPRSLSSQIIHTIPPISLEVLKKPTSKWLAASSKKRNPEIVAQATPTTRILPRPTLRVSKVDILELPNP